MFVTVIINTYKDKSNYLHQAVESYIRQINVNVTIIISTVENDPSIKYIIENFPIQVNNETIQFSIIPLKEHPGKGPIGIYYQLNKACEKIPESCQYMTYASGNDVALRDKLFNEIITCKQNNKKICYSNFYQSDKDLKNKKITNFPKYDYQKHLKGNFVTDCSLIETKLLKEFLPFKSEWRNAAYWDLWLRIYEKYGNQFCLNQKPAFIYRITDESQHLQIKQNKEKYEEDMKYKKLMIENHL